MSKITTNQLICKANELKNKTLGWVAKSINNQVPQNLQSNKGWIGQTIEKFLGATANSKPIPDFPDLGIELKTIPIDNNLKPLESTYICKVPPNNHCYSWKQSPVYKKLCKILWVPIISSSSNISERIIHTPILWQPDAATENVLQQDWEELSEIMQLDIESLHSGFGTYLHIRPKAANSKASIAAVDQYANTVSIVPRGFYLRCNFTHGILLDTI